MEIKMKAVELKNVSKKYGSRTILENVSFSVEKGEMVSLIGPSGCGKSTLLNMIGVLEEHDSGEIIILGKKLPSIESKKATLLRRNTINYLFQSYALISDMTVWQNLFLAMNFLDISKKRKIEKINEVLTKIGILSLKNEMVNTLSGGEQQRVALARTILKPGELVLADEPTGSLDAVSAENVFGLIQNLCKQYKKTVIMVTHSRELAERTDRIIDLKDFEVGIK